MDRPPPPWPRTKETALHEHQQLHDALLQPQSRQRVPTRRWLPLLILAAVAAYAWRHMPSCSRHVSVHTSVAPLTGESAFAPQQPLSDNGLTNVVQWDKHSLYVRGQRIFLWSGEFHPFRLPVPSLWPDILEKMKAAGMNAVSIYIDWALVSPSRGVLDYSGWRAVTPFLDACMAAGLFVIIRPGPYINAEVNAGGIPPWITSELDGELRGNGTNWKELWQPYILDLIEQTRDYQITEGGPIIGWQIENEYTSDPNVGSVGKAEYMQQLIDFVKDNGIIVPTTYNDARMLNLFAHGLGSSDIYGFDSYPQSFDCEHADVWTPVESNYRWYHERTNPEHPLYIPEFQAGAYDAWGPKGPGYDKCRVLTGPDFESVFYKHLIESGATMVNLYMMYGGTNWGSMVFPKSYTSYDYGSPIQENRELPAKYTELKRLGLFLRSARDLTKTEFKGNTTDGSGAVLIDNPSVLATALVNPDSRAGFYVLRHLQSNSTADAKFHLTVKTSAGYLTLPQAAPAIELAGRQAKIVVTDFDFGERSRALYSTAEVFLAATFGKRDVLFLHGDPRHWQEIVIKFSGRSTGPRIWSSDSLTATAGHQQVQFTTADFMSSATVVTILPGLSGLATLWDSETQLVLYADSETAGKFFAPVLQPGDYSTINPYGAFWSIGSNATVLVGGPYLVRSATLQDNSKHLALRGDIKEDTYLTVIAPEGVREFSWNGEPVEALSVAASGSLSVRRAWLARRPETVQALRSFVAPKLDEWVFHDGLPEIGLKYDDSTWVSADKNETLIPYKPLFGPPPVLYGCDYGFCEGTVLWRGHFKGSKSTTAANFTINGGQGFAASVWLNGHFIKTTYGNSTNNKHVISETNELYEFPRGAVKVGRENVITIVQDNQGLEETIDYIAATSRSPRGIRGALLEGGEFTHWKVQGKQGGYTKFPDKLRGISNEGGTYPERQGWHLPGFSPSTPSGWTARALSSGLPYGAAGVGVFITKFTLDIQHGLDVPMAFVFDNGVGENGLAYRAYLFVNGWQMGKRVANLGPQAKFPVHEGILDYRGENTVVVVLWAMEKDRKIRPKLELEVGDAYEAGMGPVATTNPVWIARADAV